MGHSCATRRTYTFSSWAESSSTHATLSTSLTLSASLHVDLLVVVFHDCDVFLHKVAGKLFHVCFFPEGKFMVCL